MSVSKHSLKILHVLDHSLPLHSGYAFRSLNILRVQKSIGWQSVVVTSPKHEKHFGKGSALEEEVAGFRHYRSGCVTESALALVGELRLVRRLEQRLRKVIQTESPDIIHAHSPILNGLPAIKVGKKLGIPVVYEVRALWEDAAVDHGTYKQNSWRYRVTRALETWVCQRADQITVLCNGLKADLISRGIPGHKLTVAPNGVDVDGFKIGEQDANFKDAWNLAGKTVIGFIGSFYRYEGIDLLVSAVARLRQKRPNIVLLLIGGGEVEQELKIQIRELRVEDIVLMPGRIPHERIPGVYGLTDVFVYPRLSMRLTELVTPLKPLEAMAMGGAVIASDIGGHRELVQDGYNGLLVAPGSASKLAEVVDRILDDSSLRQRLGRQAASWVRRERSWETLGRIYDQVYSAALQHEQGP
jgi:PEP-CTERM/exosortase A-associated glycosyltransferase